MQECRLLRQATFHLQGRDSAFRPSLVPFGYRLTTTDELSLIIGPGLVALTAGALLFHYRERLRGSAAAMLGAVRFSSSRVGGYDEAARVVMIITPSPAALRLPRKGQPVQQFG